MTNAKFIESPEGDEISVLKSKVFHLEKKIEKSRLHLEQEWNDKMVKSYHDYYDKLKANHTLGMRIQSRQIMAILEE